MGKVKIGLLLRDLESKLDPNKTILWLSFLKVGSNNTILLPSLLIPAPADHIL